MNNQPAPYSQIISDSSPNNEQGVSIQQAEAPHQMKAQNLISKDLQIKLSALSMTLKQLPEQINKYFYDSGIEINENRIMSFELLQLSTFERVFNELKAGFTKQLIEGNKTTNLTHRQQFHDVLSSQLISLISISKFELINICLIGFDMYVKPFDAILDIVNRISKFVVQVQRYQIDYSSIIVNGSVEKEKSLIKGLNEFTIYKNMFMISFYIQMLEEYLKKASKALDKKEKQIIFTGCFSIYDMILPNLCSNQIFGLLFQLSNLNYELWNFSNSFDYFYFYQKLPIVDKLEPVFYKIKKMVDKSLLSNTLTPFIFGVLRHHASFINFFQTINSSAWVKYAEAAVLAILLTFKSLSLPFKQMQDLMNTILKCSRLSPSVFEVLIKNINNPFEKQWSDIDPFFRSSLKAGHNSGGYALFHKLSEEELEAAFKQFKFRGILHIRERIDDNKLRQWLHVIESNQEIRNKQYEIILQKLFQQIDPSFTILNIQRSAQSNIQHTLKLCEVEDLLYQIKNCLQILKVGFKDLLRNQSLANYLQQILFKLQCAGVNTNQFNTYLLQDSLSKQSLTTNHFNLIATLKIKEETLQKFTNKILNLNIRGNPVNITINNLMNIRSINPLFEQYKNQIDTVYFSQIHRLCHRYLQYGLEGLKLEDVCSQFNTLNFYFSSQELTKIIQTKYRIRNQRLQLINKRPRNIKVHTIKTLDGALEIDSSLAELTFNSKKFILELIALIVENPQNVDYMDLLIELVEKYPIINYFVLSTTVHAGHLKNFLNNDTPQYLNFSNFLLKQIMINQKSLSLLKKLMNNGMFICFNQKNLLKDFINVNIVDSLIRDIVKLSKSINKEKLIKLMQSLYELIKQHRVVDSKLHRQIVPASLSVLRTLIRVSDTQVIKISRLFDNFVRLGLRSNYEKMMKEIQIDHLRVTSNSVSNISAIQSQSSQFPALQIVIFYQDQGIIESKQLERENEDIFERHAINLDPTTLKLQVVYQQENLVTQSSIFDASSIFVVNPVIQQIIGDTPIIKSESQIVQKYYTPVYIYPELSSSQLNFAVRDFFLNSSDIQPCLLNTFNSYRIVLISLSILLQKLKQKQILKLKQQQPLRTVLKDVINEDELVHKCMYLIQKAGYMKFLNQPINNLTNIPHEYSSIRQIVPQNQPIIFILFKMILSDPELISTGFIQRYPSTQIRSRCHEIFYNVKTTSNIINLILSRLSKLGVQNLSFFIHSNPESLREYLEVATEIISSSNIHSHILNYHELFKLTKQPLSDPEFFDKFLDFILNIEFYVKVLDQRISLMIEQTKSSLYYKHKNGKDVETILKQYTLEKQNYFLNIISYLQQFITKSSIPDLLKRHADLFKDLIESNVNNQILAKLQIVPILKQLCSKFVDDSIVLPTFIHHNRYNSTILQRQEFRLPELIENWECTVVGNIQIGNPDLKVENSKTSMISYEEIVNLESLVNTSYNIIKDHKEQDDIVLIKQLLQSMIDKKLIKIDPQLTILQSNKTVEQLALFKILGFITSNIAIKNKKLPFTISDQVRCFLRLNKLPWKLVQPRNKKIYDDIMIVLDEKISTKQLGLRFEYRVGSELVQLIPGGSERLVTESNKKEYCNSIALLEFRKILPEINQFVNGFYKVYTLGAILPNI